MPSHNTYPGQDKKGYTGTIDRGASTAFRNSNSDETVSLVTIQVKLFKAATLISCHAL
jgi:hypothetical protein